MLLGFLLTALYVPGIGGAATTPRWALLAIALPLLMIGQKGRDFTLAHLFGVLFIAWSALSIAWTPNRLDSVNELVKWVILAQAFVYGASLKDLGPTFRGMAYGLLISSAVVVASIWLPEIVLHTTSYSGLFINSGSLAEITALVLIGLLSSRGSAGDGNALIPSRRLVGVAPNPRVLFLVFGFLPCIILPQSRGAWLALAAAFTVWLWSKSKLSALALVALVAILITYSFYIGFHVESVAQRLSMWHDAIGALTWRGHGLGSLWTDYPPLASLIDTYKERPEHLHNDLLEIAFEGGAVGWLFLCAILWIVIRENGSREQLVLAGFLAEALVGFPLHNPATGFVAALCLGHLVRNGIDIRDLFWTRRVLLRPRVSTHRPWANDDDGPQQRGRISA